MTQQDKAAILADRKELAAVVATDWRRKAWELYERYPKEAGEDGCGYDQVIDEEMFDGTARDPLAN